MPIGRNLALISSGPGGLFGPRRDPNFHPYVDGLRWLLARVRIPRTDHCESFKMRVALAQTCPACAPSGKLGSDGDPFTTLRANLADAEERIAKAAAQEADVVIFPEYCLQGIVDEQREVELRSC